MKKKIISAVIASVLTLTAIITALIFVFAGNEPAEPIIKYDMADEMRKVFNSLEYDKTASAGHKYKAYPSGTTLSSLSFGPYKITKVKGNADLDEIEKKGTDYIVQAWAKNGGEKLYDNPQLAVATDENQGYTGLSFWRKYYAIGYEFTFTAPAAGTYTIGNRTAKNDNTGSIVNTGDSDVTLTIAINDVAQKLNDGNETLTVATGATDNVEGLESFHLNKGDVVKFVFTVTNTSGWGGGTTYLNIGVDALEFDANLKENFGSYNPGESLRNTFASSPKLLTAMADNQFGQYTLTLVRDGTEQATFVPHSNGAALEAIQDGGYWSAKTSSYPGVRVVTGVNDASFPGIGMKNQDWGNHTLMITFTAPTDGKYDFIPKAANASKEGSVYNGTKGKVNVTLSVKDEAKKMVGNETTLTVATGATGNLPEYKGLDLKRGDTIVVTFNVDNSGLTSTWGWFYALINFDINLVETDDESYYLGGITLSDAEAKAGEEVYIDLSVSEMMQKISGVSTTVKFDKNVFEFVKAENLFAACESYQIVDNGTGELGVVYVDDENVIGNNIIVRLYFKVKANAAPADYKITPGSGTAFVKIDADNNTKADTVFYKTFVAGEATVTVKAS